MWVGRLHLLSVFWSSWIGPKLWFWTSQPRRSHINDPEGFAGSAGKRWVSERIQINHSAGLFDSSAASWERRGGVRWGVTLGVDVLKLIKHINGLFFVKNRLVYFLTSFSPTALRLGGAGEDETEKSHFQITPSHSYSESQHGFCKQTAEFIY